MGLPGAVHSQEKTFEETTRVVEIQIPVNVIDREGEAVRGLTAEDFEIYDEGRRQEISGFQTIDLAIVEPGETRTEVERALPAAARRHILLLFDLSFSRPAAVLRARQAAREFVLNSVHPTDLVAVATHTVESGPQLIVTFTPDRAQVARGIDTLGAPRLLQLAQRDPLRFIIDDPSALAYQASSDIPVTGSTDGILADMQQTVSAHLRVVAKTMARAEKSFARGRISSWTASMESLARLLDSVQGRKHVVFFSEGFDGRLLLGREQHPFDRASQEDRRALESGQHWLVDMDDFYGNTNLQTDVALMLEEFRRADCVIQAVDISGLTSDSAARERIHRTSQDALFYVAHETGGELYEDATDFHRELEEVLQRSTVTYLLTFQPSNLEADGSYHRIRVRGNFPKGSSLSYRQGYYAPRPYEELHPFEKSLLASDAIASAAPKRDVGVSVLAAPFRATQTSAYVPVIIEVEGAGLLAGHEGDTLPVELYTYVTDAQGEMRDFFTQLVQLNLSSQQTFREAGLKYYGHLDLEPGDYLVRVLVRNATSGRTGVATVPLTVPDYRESIPVLLPPFFLEPPGRWALVREERQDPYQKSVIYPFTVNGEPFIPAARPLLKKRQKAHVCLVVYNLGDGEVEVDGRLFTEDGGEVDGGRLALVERTVTGIEGLDKLLASFRPQGLEPGRYTLQVAVTTPSSGSPQVSSIPLTILD